MKALFILTFTFLTCGAHALETWKINRIDAVAPSTPFAKKLELKQATLVDHPLYTIEVPKGWSCGQSANDSIENFLCAPNKDLDNATTYFSIHKRQGKTENTMQGTLEAFKKNPNRKVSLKTINGQSWVYTTMDGNIGTVPSKQWALTTIKGTTEMIVLGATPASDSAKYSAAIDAMIDSVKLK